MDIKELIVKIKKSDAYLKWDDKDESYLAHIFKMLDEINKNEYQVGFYNLKNRKITTFIFNEELDTIQIHPESETFKETEEHIKKLDLEKVKFSSLEALEKVNKFKEEKYSMHPVDKSFFIVQNLDKGQVWNFTFITKTFHVLNIKIDSEEGNVIEDEINSVFEFKNKQ